MLLANGLFHGMVYTTKSLSYITMKHLVKLALVVLLAFVFVCRVYAESVLYGYQMGDESLKFGFVSFTISDCSNVTMLKSTSMYYNHISAGEYFDGRLYAYTVEPDDFGGMYPNSFAVYDAETFELLSETLQSDGVRVVDMTYDVSTNTMYALAEEKYGTADIGKTCLCIVNMDTGNLTSVGSAGELKAVDGYGREVDAVLVTLAADGQGNIYAMSDYRQFYKLDKYTGKASEIGTPHKIAVTNKFQSMTFDTDGTLYWSHQHPDYGYLTKVDPMTGVPTVIGTLGKNAQITSLFVKKELDKSFPNAVENLKASVDVENPKSVRLEWTLPVSDYSGVPVSLTSVKVYRLGTSEPLAVLPANATSYVDTDADNGMNTYLVTTVTTKATGAPSTVEVYAGYDKLCAVDNLRISLVDNKVSLNWNAPTATVNGGYSDFSNITYNVYRKIGADMTEVASGISDCEFSETLTKSGVYAYVVEPVSCGVTGESATSDEVKLIDIASIPYFTGFEDDEDGPLWTFINDHTNTSLGWSIVAGYAYQQLDGKFAQMKTGGSADTGRDWLISPPIHFEAGTYKIKYYVDNSTSIDTHSWEVKLGTDNSDVTTFQQSVGRYENIKLNTDWDNIYEETFDVSSAGDYYVGFYGFSTSTFATMKIDNLAIESIATGINEIVAESGIRYYNGNVYVTSDTGICSWAVVDMQGRTLMKESIGGANTASISFDGFASGVYIVSVVLDNGNTLVSKIIRD